MRSLIDILHLSTDYLKQRGISHPRRQAEELLGEVLGIGRMGLYLEHDRPLTAAELDQCRTWLKRRVAGEPLQYISGQVDFYDCRFTVNSNVLIPRQETEILVDKVAKELSTMPLEGKVLWDVCCGSGCIGISLKKKFPVLTVTLSDLSPEALSVAQNNAAANNVEVECLTGDLLAPFEQRRADFIVCNPPYVNDADYDCLDPEVRLYEPRMALVAGSKGTEFYQRLAYQLPQVMHPQGKVWLEIGDGQAEALYSLFSTSYWTNRHHECDWSGRERFFFLQRT